jgi:hypothetical protein
LYEPAKAGECRLATTQSVGLHTHTALCMPLTLPCSMPCSPPQDGVYVMRAPLNQHASVHRGLAWRARAVTSATSRYCSCPSLQTARICCTSAQRSRRPRASTPGCAIGEQRSLEKAAAVTLPAATSSQRHASACHFAQRHASACHCAAWSWHPLRRGVQLPSPQALSRSLADRVAAWWAQRPPLAAVLVAWLRRGPVATERVRPWPWDATGASPGGPPTAAACVRWRSRATSQRRPRRAPAFGASSAYPAREASLRWRCARRRGA